MTFEEAVRTRHGRTLAHSRRVMQEVERITRESPEWQALVAAGKQAAAEK